MMIVCKSGKLAFLSFTMIAKCRTTVHKIIL